VFYHMINITAFVPHHHSFRNKFIKLSDQETLTEDSEQLRGKA